MLAKDLNDGKAVSYLMYASNGAAPSGWFHIGGTHETVDGPSALPVNEWSHLAVTYDGTIASLFVNGTQVEQKTISGSIELDAGTLTIGGNRVWGEYFEGSIDEVRIYNRAQTAEQIQTDMNSPITASGPTPTATPTVTPTTTPTPQAVSLPLLADTYVSTYADSQPQHTALWVGGFWNYDQMEFERTYLQFDTSQLAGKAIVDAKLELYNSTSDGCGVEGQSLKVQRVTGTWEQNSITWQTQPSVTMSGAATATDPGICGDVNATWTWQIKDIVGAWTSGANRGLMLRADIEDYEGEPYDRAFHSSERTGTDVHPPKLTVTYLDNPDPAAQTSAGTKPPASSLEATPSNGLRTEAEAASDSAPKFTFDRITPAKCFEHLDEADSVEGWEKNRFSWCQLNKWTAMRWGGYCAQCGPFSSQIYTMLIGSTFQGSASTKQEPKAFTSRDIVIDVYVYRVDTVGQFFLSKTFGVGIDIGNKPYCNHVQTWNGNPQTNHRQMTISQWKLTTSTSTPAFQARLHCDLEHAPSNPEFKVSTNVEPYSQYSGWKPKWKFNRGDAAVVRCDSAPYIGFDGGCVYNDALSSVEFKLGQNYDMAYQHYWKACYDRWDTYPDSPVKAVLPGCYNYTTNSRPTFNLHRVREPEQTNNNARARTRCNSLWPNYSTKGLECDEYPFASTRERSAEIDQQRTFSVCTIPQTHNGAAGGILNRLYDRERLLIGDPFFLRFNKLLDGQAAPRPPTRDQLCTPADPNSPYS